MMHNVSRLGSRQGFTRQILIDKGVKAFPQSRFCHSREETSMNRFRFQQGICYPQRKFPLVRPVSSSMFPDVSGVLRPTPRAGQRWRCLERPAAAALVSGRLRISCPVQGRGRFKAMNQQMNEMNSNEQSCHGAGFPCGTAAAQRAPEFLELLAPARR